MSPRRCITAIILLTALATPTLAGANGIPISEADSIRRGTLGTVDGRSLNYRVYSVTRMEFGTTRTYRRALVFFADDQQHFDALPSEASRSSEDDEPLDFIADDRLNGLIAWRDADSKVPEITYDSDAKTVVFTSTTPSSGRGDVYDREQKKVYAWQPNQQDFSLEYTETRTPEFVDRWKMLRAADNKHWPEAELRTLLIQSSVPTYYHSLSCDISAAAVVLKVAEQRINSLLDQNRQRAAVEVLSAFTRFKHSRQLPTRAVKDERAALHSPLCGAISDMDTQPPGYGSGFAVTDGANAVGCAIERDDTCHRGKFEVRFSAEQVRDLLFKWADLAAEHGYIDLAIWLTYAIPTHGQHQDQKQQTGEPLSGYPLARHGAPTASPGSILAKRTRLVIAFADEQHDAGRTHLAAAWYQRLADTPTGKFASEEDLPDRVSKRAGTLPEPAHTQITDLDDWTDSLTTHLANGHIARATGALIDGYNHVASHVASGRKDTSSRAVAFSSVYPATLQAIEQYTRRINDTELAGQFARFALTSHPLAQIPRAFELPQPVNTQSPPDFVITTTRGLYLPLTPEHTNTISYLQSLLPPPNR